MGGHNVPACTSHTLKHLLKWQPQRSWAINCQFSDIACWSQNRGCSLHIILHHLVSCHQLSNKGLLGKQQGLYDFMYCSVFWEIVYCPSDGSKYDTTHEPLARSRRFHPKTDPELNCIRMFLILPALSWDRSLTEFPYAHWEFVVSLYLRLLCPATGYFLTQLYFIRESFMPVWALKCSNCESPNVVYGGKNKKIKMGLLPPQPGAPKIARPAVQLNWIAKNELECKKKNELWRYRSVTLTYNLKTVPWWSSISSLQWQWSLHQPSLSYKSI